MHRSGRCCTRKSLCNTGRIGRDSANSVRIRVISHSGGSMKRFASLVALTMFATVATATPAFAAQCSPGSCNGLDPQTTQCVDDARNVASFRYSGGNPYLRGALMELRHSRTCDAAWVRTTD